MITLLALCCFILVTLVVDLYGQRNVAHSQLQSLSLELEELTAECVRGDLVYKLLRYDLKASNKEIIALKLALRKRPWVLARIGPKDE